MYNSAPGNNLTAKQSFVFSYNCKRCKYIISSEWKICLFVETFNDLEKKKRFWSSGYNIYVFWKQDHNKNYKANLLFFLFFVDDFIIGATYHLSDLDLFINRWD